MIRTIFNIPLKRAVCFRTFHTSSYNGVREIITTKEAKLTTIEGKILPSPRKDFLVEKDSRIVNNACILCQLNLNIKHTDVLILQQFVTSEGAMLPRHVTGLCLMQYRKINQLVAMAQEAGLLGNFVTWEGKFDISQRVGFKKQNTYFDENTIVIKRKNGWMRKHY